MQSLLSPTAPTGQQSNTSSSAAWERYDQATDRVYKQGDHSPAAQRELAAATIYLQAAIAGAVRS